MAAIRIASRHEGVQDAPSARPDLPATRHMTERDAFGRPLSGPGPVSQSVHGPSPSPSPSGQPPRRDGSALRRFLWWFVAIDLIVIVAIAAVLLGGGDGDDDVVIIPPKSSATQTAPSPAGSQTDASDDDGDGADEEAPAESTVAPAGFNATSLMRAANLERALDAAKALGQGKPLMLRAEASRVDLQLARPDGSLVIMQVRAGSAPSVITRVAGAAKGRSTMSWSALDPGAPQRMARATKSTPEAGPRSTSYVVFLEQTRRWVLYRTSGKGFIGDASGRGGTQIPGT